MNTANNTILVVDDDYDIRRSIGSALEDEGYSIALAENGAVGLQKLREGLRVKLILLDIMMPVLDGFEFCRAWKEDTSLRDIPVVIVSADGSTDQKARTCGATGWIRKPVQLDQLLDVAARYVV
jgi:CheY-like chemotaxis protein